MPQRKRAGKTVHFDSSLSPKGQRTREALRRATKVVLERLGYHGAKVADVAAEAEVAVGLFYHYFPDLKTAACDVLAEFRREIDALAHDLPPAANAFDAIYRPTLVWTQAYATQPGLMRCLSQVAAEVPEFREIWLLGNQLWTRRVARRLMRQFDPDRTSDRLFLGVAYTLGSMVDGLLNEIYVRRNPELCDLLSTPQQVAELLSFIWYRAVYLENPPAELLTLSAPLLSMAASLGR